MENVFLKVLNMSITAGWLVLAVLLLRPVLKKAPKWILCALWALVGLRLAVPFSPESSLSLIPSAQTIPDGFLYDRAPAIDSGISSLNSAVNPLIYESLAPKGFGSVNPAQVWAFIGANLWILGMAAMAVYAAVSYWLIHRRVREAAPMEGNVWLCDHIESPFILGIFRPRIYLPSSMDEGNMAYVIAHEKAHLKRLDHLWKPLGFTLLAVYWFNPLLWAAYILLCRDIEFACDEKVLRQLGSEAKKPYSQALINCSVPRKMVAACPLAFGEVGVKGRIRSVLNYKKPAFWIVLVSVIALAMMTVCFLTDPAEEEQTPVAETGQTNEIAALLENVEGIETCYRGGSTQYLAAYPDFIVGYLRNMELEKKPVSADQEIWNNDYAVIINEQTKICFNESCTELYVVRDGKKTGSYVISDPVAAEEYMRCLRTFARAAYLDTIRSDIDNDGVDEICALSYGPTSGVSSYSVAIWEAGEWNASYEGWFSWYSHCTAGFEVQADGTIKIRLGDQGEEPQAIRYIDLEMENGDIVFSVRL